MDKRIEAGWSGGHLQLPESHNELLFSNAYDAGSLPPFVGSSYPAELTSATFTTSNDISPNAASASGSYDSLPASVSTGQLYDDSSNDSSVLNGSIFARTLGSSSVTSSLTSAGQDALSDGSSRKASLSSIYDGPLSSHLMHSPEIEGAAGWSSASHAAIQPSSAYSLSYGSTHTAAAHALHSASLYSSAGVHAGSSQPVNTYKYSDTLRILSPTNISGLHIKVPSSDLHRSTNLSIDAPTTTSPRTQVFPSEAQATTMSLQPPKGKSYTKTRSSTSGSTRRAKFQRSRTGCLVCRKRKVKCDQDGQPCKQCRIGKRDCYYEENPQKRKRVSSKSKSDSSESARKEKDSSEEAESVLINVSPRVSQKLKNFSSALALASRVDLENDLSGTVMDREASRRAKEDEEEEELKKASDALFAQHTNFDQAEGEGEEDPTSSMIEAVSLVQDIQKENDFEALQMRYDHQIDANTSWPGRSDLTASMTTTDDWSTDTPSTGPSSLRTTDEDPLQYMQTHESTISLPKASKIDSSPFHTFLDLDDDTHGTTNITQAAAENSPWYGNQNESNETALGVNLIMTDGHLKHE